MAVGAWSNFKKSWRHQAAMQVATLSVLIGSFSVMSISALVHQNMARMLSHWGQEVKVNVYLKEDAGDAHKQKISDFLKNNEMFSGVHLLSKKEAAEKFKKRVGQYLPGILSDLDFDNPIPASFEMVVSGGISSGARFDSLYGVVQKIKQLAGVDEVSYGQGWVENYASVLKVFSITSGAFIFILLSGVLFVIGNSIRNAISQRREEIEILELCGATRGMIMWPYIFEGLLMGLLSSCFSIAVTYVAFVWQTDVIAKDLSFWNFTANIEFLSTSRIIAIALIGTALGGFGSFIWARQISTGWAAAEASSKHEI